MIFATIFLDGRDFSYSIQSLSLSSSFALGEVKCDLAARITLQYSVQPGSVSATAS